MHKFHGAHTEINHRFHCCFPYNTNWLCLFSVHKVCCLVWCMYMVVCTYTCASRFTCLCTCGPEVNVGCLSFIVLDLYSWDRAPHWTWSYSICLAWLAHEPQVLLISVTHPAVPSQAHLPGSASHLYSDPTLYGRCITNWYFSQPTSCPSSNMIETLKAFPLANPDSHSVAWQMRNLIKTFFQIATMHGLLCCS